MEFISSLYYFIPLFIVGLVDFVIAAFVLFNKRNITIFLFALWSICVGFWSLFVSLMNIGNLSLMPFGFKAAAWSGAFIPFLFLILSFVFPDRKLKLSLLNFILLSIPVWIFAYFAPTNAWISFSYTAASTVIINVKPLWAFFYLMYYVAYLSIGTIYLYLSYLKSTALIKQQFIYLFLGLFLSFMFGIFCTILPVYLGVGKFLYFGPLGTIFFIVFTAYAITKHELMDIRLVISRGLAYSISAGLLIASFIGLNALRMPISLAMGMNALLALFWAWGAHRLRAFIQTPLEEKWITGWYDPSKLMNQIAQKLVPVLERDEAFKVVAEGLKNAIKIKKVDILNKLECPDIQEVKRDGKTVVIPFKSSEGSEGGLRLAEKVSEDSYDEKDMLLFRTLQVQILAILDRIRPYEEIKKELEATQVQLDRTQRLASLGTLAAGIAHEIRNPLGIIHSKTDKLDLEPRDLEYLKDFKESVLRNSQRISSIITNMLGLVKTRERKMTRVNLNEIIETTLQLFTISRIRLVKKLEAIPDIEGDPEELKQVFINLIENAVAAMPEGGDLNLKTHPIYENASATVCVDVSDTGRGIARENLSKIFDPFFSTHHEGAGLGLSIVYRIVREHGGTIEAKSEEGKGAVFSLRFPASS